MTRSMMWRGGAEKSMPVGAFLAAARASRPSGNGSTSSSGGYQRAVAVLRRGTEKARPEG
jgi:hypothetical protein